MHQISTMTAAYLLGTLLLAAPGFADIPPPDACASPADVGKACDNAGAQANQPGTCQADTCSKATPDGPMTYECTLCKSELGDGGPPDRGRDAGSSEPAPDAGTKDDPPQQPLPDAATAGHRPQPDKGTAADPSEPNKAPPSGGGKATGGSKASAKPPADTDNNESSSSDDGGCAVSMTPNNSSVAGFAAAFAALGLAVARRRRSQRG
ncbi:MAG: hypothetical protein RJA70_1217 [Pseudomonadota bacterium]